MNAFLINAVVFDSTVSSNILLLLSVIQNAYSAYGGHEPRTVLSRVQVVRTCPPEELFLMTLFSVYLNMALLETYFWHFMVIHDAFRNLFLAFYGHTKLPSVPPVGSDLELKRARDSCFLKSIGCR